MGNYSVCWKADDGSFGVVAGETGMDSWAEAEEVCSVFRAEDTGDEFYVGDDNGNHVEPTVAEALETLDMLADGHSPASPAEIVLLRRIILHGPEPRVITIEVEEPYEGDNPHWITHCPDCGLPNEECQCPDGGNVPVYPDFDTAAEALNIIPEPFPGGRDHESYTEWDDEPDWDDGIDDTFGDPYPTEDDPDYFTAPGYEDYFWGDDDPIGDDTPDHDDYEF